MCDFFCDCTLVNTTVSPTGVPCEWDVECDYSCSCESTCWTSDGLPIASRP